MNNKKIRPTSYIVMFWNKDGTKKIKEEIYPMYKFTLDDVIVLLKGKEETCDIYEGRFWKNRGRYITTRNTYIWDGYGWKLQM